MQGFGPVRREPNEPLFHAPWERTVFGMFFSTLAKGLYNLDEARHAIERMEPAHYLTSTYYEHWLAGMERLLVEKGIATPGEIERHVAAVASFGGDVALTRKEDPAFAEALAAGVAAGFPANRESRRKPRFRVGDRVRVKRIATSGHTRCPRYVRGAVGRIAIVHGIHVFPDASAHGHHEEAAPLYNVSFSARELWGEEGAGKVSVDLWEPYLEPLEPAGPKAKEAAPAAKTPSLVEKALAEARKVMKGATARAAGAAEKVVKKTGVKKAVAKRKVAAKKKAAAKPRKGSRR
jgi:nitrile hydratase subunit beta